MTGTIPEDQQPGKSGIACKIIISALLVRAISGRIAGEPIFEGPGMSVFMNVDPFSGMDSHGRG